MLDDIEATARSFVDQLRGSPIGSPGLERAIRAIDRLGEREIVASTQIAARFQEHPLPGIAEVLAPRSSLARHLVELRDAAGELAGTVRRTTAREGGDPVASSEARETETRLRVAVAELDADRAALERDCAVIDQQEVGLWRVVLGLRRDATLAGRIDHAVADWIESVSATEPAHARTLQVEVQTAIRRRRRDLLTQLAIATQGLAALRRLEQDRLELIWAIRSATTATASAIRTTLVAVRAAPSSPALPAPAGPAVSAGTGRLDVDETLGDMERAIDEVDRRRRAAGS